MLLFLETLRKAAPVFIGLLITFVSTLFISEKIAFSQGNLIRGRALYGMNCRGCHGESGRGDGPQAALLKTKPLNFTDPRVMDAIQPEKLERSVVVGLPNVAGHNFGHLLSSEEVGDISEYVRSLLRR